MPPRLLLPTRHWPSALLFHSLNRFPQPTRSRHIFTNPFSIPGLSSTSTTTATPQTLHAARTLPYPAPAIYDIVTDVSAYTAFLPHCQRSIVTRWSSPSSLSSPTSSPPSSRTTTGRGQGGGGKSYPTLATLTVGYKSFTETFTSAIVCDPASGTVTALSGDAASQITGADGKAGAGVGRAADKGVFESLWTRWRVVALEGEGVRGSGNGNGRGAGTAQTRVELELEFRFANPVYAALSSAVTPVVAGRMVEAFEGRVREVLGPATEGR